TRRQAAARTVRETRRLNEALPFRIAATGFPTAAPRRPSYPPVRLRNAERYAGSRDGVRGRAAGSHRRGARRRSRRRPAGRPRAALHRAGRRRGGPRGGPPARVARGLGGRARRARAVVGDRARAARAGRRARPVVARPTLHVSGGTLLLLRSNE